MAKWIVKQGEVVLSCCFERSKELKPSTGGTKTAFKPVKAQELSYQRVKEPFSILRTEF